MTTCIKHENVIITQYGYVYSPSHCSSDYAALFSRFVKLSIIYILFIIFFFFDGQRPDHSRLCQRVESTGLCLVPIDHIYSYLVYTIFHIILDCLISTFTFSVPRSTGCLSLTPWCSSSCSSASSSSSW